MLQAQIKNFSYQKNWHEQLENFDFKNINSLPGKCLINFQNKTLALSKWVSPKRTRSYPYARVYDTFDSHASKIVTIIPIIKDEGINGDMDYLQWDTISLMSLLNVYVILGFYDKAEIHPKKADKITKQEFNNEYILGQLTQLIKYHQSALHWNLNQLSSEKLTKLAELAKNAYIDISSTLKIKLHNPRNIDNFICKISQSRETFMGFSRQKAKQAQTRESLTLQPKENIGIGKKEKIIINNYLGGQYFFTIDEVFFKNDTLYLCESKHSKNSLLPSNDDIKDGLLKLMLYNNLHKIEGLKKFKIALRLTSSLLQDSIILPNENLDSFIENNAFSGSQTTTLKALNIESKQNHFEIWINNEC
ncbi:hypothetical protein [Helicobacter turcicus]|uniref:Restriction endonuclease n=1 Tax=Helicobacter turcicus TaxID=2867412 RepID=A0ABS7JKV3_9HELI|nr:hypothetical protein [Helicobacter turcicus]MBX7490001.1 hypothetical protein [Helicobacter turcicus]MBX7544860.1 hypothetical protein [Helicobacter turcicus]